jgi:hypothetical protein
MEVAQQDGSPTCAKRINQPRGRSRTIRLAANRHAQRPDKAGLPCITEIALSQVVELRQISRA